MVPYLHIFQFIEFNVKNILEAKSFPWPLLKKITLTVGQKVIGN